MEKQVINVDINAQPTEECTQCGCPFFEQRTIIKRIIGLTIGLKEDQYQPFAFYACKYCGTPHKNTKMTVPTWSPNQKNSDPEETLG